MDFRSNYVDEFFEVLRWSKEFGADTEKGRTVKQGVIGVFAGGVFDPQEKIYLKDEAISLAAYRKIAEEKRVYSVNDESNMIFLGFIAFLDPPKETARKSLRLLRKAGSTAIMPT